MPDPGETDPVKPVVGPCACPHCAWDAGGQLQAVNLHGPGQPLALVRVHGRSYAAFVSDCGGCGEPLDPDNVKARR